MVFVFEVTYSCLCILANSVVILVVRPLAYKKLMARGARVHVSLGKHLEREKHPMRVNSSMYDSKTEQINGKKSPKDSAM